MKKRPDRYVKMGTQEKLMCIGLTAGIIIAVVSLFGSLYEQYFK